jgi:hypothetical protein
METASPDTPR